VTALPVRPAPPIYVLGGYYTDFARNFAREGKTLLDMLRESLHGVLAHAQLSALDLQTAHVGNFVGEVLSRQGHLGALLVEAEPALAGLPTARHEAACASGSMAVLAALAELSCGRYDIACVLGVEQLRSGSGSEVASALGVAALNPHETAGVPLPWPKLLGDVEREYERRHGISRAHLAALAASNFENAKRNPRAQTRGWTFGPRAFAEDDQENPMVCAPIRRYDCSQITDGGAAVILASAEAASTYAARRGLTLGQLPRITGFGHRTGRITLPGKLADSAESPYLFPHVRGTLQDALTRAGLRSAEELDAIECHDCFTVMEYMILDHCGFAPPGQLGPLIESGRFRPGGKTPVNPSGGLMGVGHPVGASGVRMLVDAAAQVRGEAGAYQVADCQRAATFNIGGSAATSACFIVERGA
jgi:acetyl-CoA C-acetyltransferase